MSFKECHHRFSFSQNISKHFLRTIKILVACSNCLAESMAFEVQGGGETLREEEENVSERERARMEQNIKPLIMNVKECEIALEKREREQQEQQ